MLASQMDEDYIWVLLAERSVLLKVLVFLECHEACIHVGNRIFDLK